LMYVNMTDTYVTMYLYPVPTQDLAFHFISVTPLVQPATTGTTLVLPPGYLDAFTFNLALRLAPEFGVEPSKDLRRNAASSKRNVKRINNPNDVMSMPSALLGCRHGDYFNINTGY